MRTEQEILLESPFFKVASQVIEVKAGLYYTRLPYSTMGIDLAIKFLEAVNLEIIHGELREK